jgi:hypothetical protein
MRPYYEQDNITIYHGDCREVLPTLAGESVDAAVTDPPYGIGWVPRVNHIRADHGAIGIEIEERYCEIAVQRLGSLRMTSIIKQPRTWHRASEKAGQEQIADVARRAGDIDREALAWRAALPAYFQARPTVRQRQPCGRPPVPVVAVCPDGRVEHYGSVSEAAEAMNGFPSSILHVIDGMNDRGTQTFRDRRWYRAGTYKKTQGEP